jgi:hypothetical protein
MDADRQLERVQIAYAFALDRRDPIALRDVFREDATFAMYRPGESEPYVEIQGLEHIGGIVDAMSVRYARTMHVMSNSRSSVDGDDASGSVYCIAHHLIDDDGPPREVVAYIVYDDSFRRGDDGEWRIQRRDVRFQWIGEHAVLSWEDGAERGRFN